MRAAELQDITVEGLGLLPVDRVSGLGQHDELGSVSAVKLLRLRLSSARFQSVKMPDLRTAGNSIGKPAVEVATFT